jgi:cell division septation protein DedD
MQSKARMTFRFEPPKPTEPKKPTRQSTASAQKLNAEEEAHEQGFASWNSPYQDDIHALEEIIRKEEHIQAPYPILKDAAYEEPSEDRWSSETTDDEFAGHSPGAGWLNRTPRMGGGPSWGRVFLSVTAAVATGALFGYIVLSLFTGEPLFPGKAAVSNGMTVQPLPGKSSNPSADTIASPKNETFAEPTASPSSTDSSDRTGESDSESHVPAKVYYMLQYGVFKNEESMMSAVSQLQDKGLASATEASDGYRVYVGAATTRDEAESLAAQMSEIEVYIKPVEGVPVVISSPAGVAEFMNKGSELIRMLAHLTDTGLQDKQPQMLNTTDRTALKETHRQWLNTVSAVNQLGGKTAENGKTIVQALNSAVLSLTEFNRKPSRIHLWNAQSNVMKALLADRHLRLLLQPNSDG